MRKFGLNHLNSQNRVARQLLVFFGPDRSLMSFLTVFALWF